MSIGHQHPKRVADREVRVVERTQRRPSPSRHQQVGHFSRHPVGKRGQQGGLAHARLTDHEHDPTTASEDGSQVRPQPRQLILASDDRTWLRGR
jgi:hypothetical protein